MVLSLLHTPINTTPISHSTLQRPTQQQQQQQQFLHKHYKTQTKKHNNNNNNNMKEMKLVWSPERATNSYIDTVQAVTTNHLSSESGVAELVSAMAAGWNAQVIVETWSRGGVIPTSVGLSIASRHTCGRHVCIVPDERSRSEYATSMMGEAGMSPEIMVGEPEEVMEGITGIDFLVVDSRRKDFARVLRLAKLSCKGAVLICKNANFISKMDSCFIWRSVVARGFRRLVRSVFLPVGKGIHMAHVSGGGGGGGENSVSAMKHKGRAIPNRWIKHVDQRSGDVHFFRK